ncbi:MAG: PAS domain S-box protein [Nitrospiraceae bacterium]|jgi:PAS domain S-box-containing protein|uniref:PAS domain S-box protein n=1 Tax=Nitrospira cf. moscoviensis SBR1015 TaxID=96242 RepID=UPI000A09A442|nr:PAS domain S-box protein [Nitrospira cf. moscoviensis SBR1015]MBY0247100.1 PAS domain S-box protein [Nitrospiraceae bacterium]OQW31099.1 MAG: hypothetical protein A4E20_15060 [Nitrospira sp. SG-bin2]
MEGEALSTRPARQFVVPALSLMLAAGVFVLDLATPLGISVSLLYLASILLLFWAPSKVFPFIVAALCSVMTVLGFWLSPSGILPFSYGLTNRLIIVLVLWSAAFGVSTISETDTRSKHLVFGLSRRIVANLTSIGLIVILLGVGSYQMMAISWESTELVAQTNEVMTELTRALSAIKDGETGLRDLLLTGEERYVESCRKAVSEVHGHLERLADLTRDSSEQQDRLSTFTSRVEEKLAELQETLVLSQNQGAAAALRIVTADRGKALMDDLRHQAEKIEKTERGLLVQRQQLLKSISSWKIVMLALGGLMMVVVMGGIVVLLYREQRAEREFATRMHQTLVTLDATRDGVFVFDPGTLRFSYVNEGVMQQTGYSREELLGMTPLAIKPEFDEPRFRAMIEPLVSGAQRTYSFTTVHRRKDAVDVPVEINLQCVDAGTTLARMIAVARDITERKRMEVHLKEQVRRFRNIFESVPVSIWEEDWTGVIVAVASLRSQGITDFNRYFADRHELVAKLLRMVKVVDVNPQTCALFEATTKDQLLASLETVFSTEDILPGFMSELVALAEGRHIFETEMALRTVQGKLIHVLLTMTFPDLSHPTERVLVSLMDITIRKRAEEVQRRLAAIVESTDDAIIGKTMHAMITSWNKGAERLYGYKAEEIIGKSIKVLIPQERWGEEMEIIDRISRGEQIEHFETVRQARDGRLIDISLTASALKDRDGNLVGVSGIGRDITERKRVESELKRRGWLLEAANKELEAFSYSVSHDLRAPLRSLDGFSLALMEDCADRLDEQGKDYVKRIRAASQRMGQLVDDLLKLSRNSHVELRRELVDLSALVTSRAEEMRKLWPGRQVELIVEPGLKAEGDSRLLDIVVDNLLNNAWKFTGRRERALIEVGAERREGKTVYFVRDNGVGFDMAYAGKLFGAFQRVHTMAEFPGTGIGLATVQRIVRRHGGRVWIEAVVDKGATVFFTLGDERDGEASLK